MFSTELDDSFEGGVTSGILFHEASILFFHAVISNAGIRLFGDDGGKGFVRDVKEADVAPIVGTRGFSF